MLTREQTKLTGTISEILTEVMTPYGGFCEVEQEILSGANSPSTEGVSDKTTEWH